MVVMSFKRGQSFGSTKSLTAFINRHNGIAIYSNWRDGLSGLGHRKDVLSVLTARKDGFAWKGAERLHRNGIARWWCPSEFIPPQTVSLAYWSCSVCVLKTSSFSIHQLKGSFKSNRRDEKNLRSSRRGMRANEEWQTWRHTTHEL